MVTPMLVTALHLGLRVGVAYFLPLDFGLDHITCLGQ